jgi:hypothetical protein
MAKKIKAATVELASLRVVMLARPEENRKSWGNKLSLGLSATMLPIGIAKANTRRVPHRRIAFAQEYRP